MGQILRLTLEAFCVVAMIATTAHAAITIDCAPDAAVVSHNQTIEVACVISTDQTVSIKATQVDLPCSLPG